MSEFNRTDIKRFFSEVMYESIDRHKEVLQEGGVFGPGAPGQKPDEGFIRARVNLKNALEGVYQKVVDDITHRFDPEGEGNMIDQTMTMAYQSAVMEIRSIVDEFLKGIRPPDRFDRIQR